MSQEYSPALVDTPIIAAETHPAVSWAAVFAGASATLAVSVVLSTLAAGFGLKLISGSPSQSASLDAFTPVLGACTVAGQVVSSALGGYIAGRLRTKWVYVHSHEAHFRDTAHGLLAWAVSTIAGLLFVAAIASEPNDLATSQVAPADPTALAAMSQHAADLAAQASLFIGFGLLLSAFSAAVAAAIGGLRRDEMSAKYWTDEHVATQPPAR